MTSFEEQARWEELRQRYVEPATRELVKRYWIRIYRESGLDLNYETGEVRDIATGQFVEQISLDDIKQSV